MSSNQTQTQKEKKAERKAETPEKLIFFTDTSQQDYPVHIDDEYRVWIKRRPEDIKATFHVKSVEVVAEHEIDFSQPNQVLNGVAVQHPLLQSAIAALGDITGKWGKGSLRVFKITFEAYGRVCVDADVIHDERYVGEAVAYAIKLTSHDTPFSGHKWEEKRPWAIGYDALERLQKKYPQLAGYSYVEGESGRKGRQYVRVAIKLPVVTKEFESLFYSALCKSPPNQSNEEANENKPINIDANSIDEIDEESFFMPILPPDVLAKLRGQTTAEAQTQSQSPLPQSPQTSQEAASSTSPASTSTPQLPPPSVTPVTATTQPVETAPQIAQETPSVATPQTEAKPQAPPSPSRNELVKIYLLSMRLPSKYLVQETTRQIDKNAKKIVEERRMEYELAKSLDALRMRAYRTISRVFAFVEEFGVWIAVTEEGVKEAEKVNEAVQAVLLELTRKGLRLNEATIKTRYNVKAIPVYLEPEDAKALISAAMAAMSADIDVLKEKIEEAKKNNERRKLAELLRELEKKNTLKKTFEAFLEYLRQSQ